MFPTFHIFVLMLYRQNHIIHKSIVYNIEMISYSLKINDVYLFIYLLLEK